MSLFPPRVRRLLYALAFCQVAIVMGVGVVIGRFA